MLTGASAGKGRRWKGSGQTSSALTGAGDCWKAVRVDGPHCTSLSSFVLLEEGLGLSGLTSWVMTGMQEIYLQQSLGIYCFTRWDGHQGHSWTRFPHGSGLRELVLWVLLSGGPQRGSSSHSPFLRALGRASRYDQGHGERSVHTFVCEDTYLCAPVHGSC